MNPSSTTGGHTGDGQVVISYLIGAPPCGTIAPEPPVVSPRFTG
jgi:hypothetical protein